MSQPVELALYAPDAAEQLRGLTLAEGAPIEGPLAAAVLTVALFSEHPKPRAAARKLLLAEGPPAVRAKLEADKRNYAALVDGPKLAKLCAEYTPGIDARTVSNAVLRAFSARALASSAWAGAAIGGALHAALAHGAGSEAEIFACVGDVERIELTIKKELPPGLGQLRRTQWLTVHGAIKSTANVAELAALPGPIGLRLTGKDLDLLVLLPAAENIDGLTFHGNASKLTDIAILRRFPRLATLGLAGTGVRDIGPLASLPLVDLSLGSVESIEPLRGKQTLTRLTIDRARCDVATLASLTHLKSLVASYCVIESGAFLAPLTQLTHLALSGTAVHDLTPLIGKPLDELYVDAPLSLAPLFDMPTLRKLGLRGPHDAAELEELKRRNPDLYVSVS